MHTDVIVVSGLPRSGTSLMMQVLHAGGIEVSVDNIRTADVDNPRGYWEDERVKKLKENSDWLAGVRGKAVKIVSQLLYDLPMSERYRVLFMERDIDEVLASQEKMLARRGQPAAARADIARAYSLHLTRLRRWLAEQSNMTVLIVKFADLVSQPAPNLQNINEFLEGRLNVEAALGAIDPPLYRNRKTTSAANPQA